MYGRRLEEIRAGRFIVAGTQARFGAISPSPEKYQAGGGARMLPQEE